MGSEGTVLVVTGFDMTADMVIGRLYERGVPVARFDLADFPASVSFAARFGTGVSGSLSTPTRDVDLERVRALYYRRPTDPMFPAMNEEDARFAAGQARYGFSGTLQALPGCLYVNHPRRSAVAEWKPEQLRVAAACGFRVPPTLISNRLEEIRAFVRDHGQVVYKPVSTVSYKVDGEPLAIWVRTVDPADLDESVAATAHLFQARVDKTADVRVTVVDGQVFCTRIDSPHLDWRENYDDITGYTVIDPPAGLAERLVAYLARFGLVYGCFDLGIGSDGVWWFYECNPAGEWGWIEHETDLPIADAFADVLQKGIVNEQDHRLATAGGRPRRGDPPQGFPRQR